MAIASYFVIKHYINKHRTKNCDGAQGPSQSEEEKQQQEERKQVALCEHKLAAGNGVTATNGVTGDGAVHSNHGQTAISDDERGPKHCPECINEKKRARHYRRKVLFSLLIPNLMASMDLTIIETALPTIASHFTQCSQSKYKDFANFINR
jgi:hypothetical protein